MTYHTLRRSQLRSNLTADSDVTRVRQFIERHGTALANAAHLLGGSGASGTVFILMESLRDACKLSRAQRNQLVNLHRLLTLQNVSDPDRLETGRFAELAPDSPEVEDICRLADSLHQVLSRISVSPADLFLVDNAVRTPSRPRPPLRRRSGSGVLPRNESHRSKLTVTIPGGAA